MASNPVQAPQPRAVLERAEQVVGLRQVLDVNLVQDGLRAGIPGPGGVVHPDRVVDPGDQVMGDRVAADQEDLGVPLAADVLEAHQRGAFVIGGQLGRYLHDPCSSPLDSPVLVTGGSVPVPSGTAGGQVG